MRQEGARRGHPAIPGTGSRAPRPSFVTAPEGIGAGSLLAFLDRRFPRVGRDLWAQRVRAGKVRDTGGRPLSLTAALQAGERLCYFREVEAEPRVPFQEEVLLATDHFLVADKPPFLPVVPAGGHVNECLLYRLVRSTGFPELAPAHRLDRDTAGLVLFSLRPETRGLYGRLFARAEVAREYRAVCRLEREPEGRSWRRESRLVPGEPFFRMRESPGEPNAATRIELVAREGDRGLFALFPETGKKHQLRLHLAALGFPIEGDQLYPRLAPAEAPDFSRPLQLLARRLAFRDPVTGNAVEVLSRRRLEL